MFIGEIGSRRFVSNEGQTSDEDVDPPCSDLLSDAKDCPSQWLARKKVILEENARLRTRDG